MSRRDRTGPMGMGAMTGRGLGLCAEVYTPNYGGGFRRGHGRGCGRGNGRGFRFGPNANYNQIASKEVLETQNEQLDNAAADQRRSQSPENEFAAFYLDAAHHSASDRAGHGSFGAAAVKEGETYTTQEMLTYAIQDEYLAQAEYTAIIAVFGVDRPFSNIVKAEATHIQHLLPLFAAYNIPVPADTATEHVILPETIQEIYKISVTAEIDNIDMYNTFLKHEELPRDVRNVFQALKSASENHLCAFQRHAGKPANRQTFPSGRR